MFPLSGGPTRAPTPPPAAGVGVAASPFEGAVPLRPRGDGKLPARQGAPTKDAVTRKITGSDHPLIKGISVRAAPSFHHPPSDTPHVTDKARAKANRTSCTNKPPGISSHSRGVERAQIHVTSMLRPPCAAIGSRIPIRSCDVTSKPTIGQQHSRDPPQRKPPSRTLSKLPRPRFQGGVPPLGHAAERKAATGKWSQPLPRLPVGGRLAHFKVQWHSISSSKFVHN